MSEKILRLIFSLLNLMGLPGVGTYLAGRKRTGILQITLSLMFFTLTVLPLFYFYHLVREEGHNYLVWLFDLALGKNRIDAKHLPPVLLAVLGLFFFSVNLAWSLMTTKPIETEPSSPPGD